MMISRLLPLLMLLLLTASGGLLLFATVEAFQMPSPVAEAKGVRSDVKHIACEACEALARHASAHFSQLRDEKKKDINKEGDESSSSSSPPSRFKRAPPAKGVLTEAEVLDAVESMADPDSDSGEWLSHLDLEIVDGKKLKLKNMGERGKCGSRCRTVAMAAVDALEGTDTDLAERLWRGGDAASPEEVTKWLCREATSACLSPSPPPLSAERAAALAREIAAEPFAPESADDAQIRKMMAGMKAQGMGGQMFDRSSVLKSLKEDDDDDEDDDDEEEEAETEEKKKEAAAEENVKAALAEVMAAEEAKNKKSEEKETAPSSSSASSDFSEKAERAKAAAKEGIAAAKGWLSAKKASLFASSSPSSDSGSTAEL